MFITYRVYSTRNCVARGLRRQSPRKMYKICTSRSKTVTRRKIKIDFSPLRTFVSNIDTPTTRRIDCNVVQFLRCIRTRFKCIEIPTEHRYTKRGKNCIFFENNALRTRAWKPSKNRFIRFWTSIRIILQYNNNAHLGAGVVFSIYTCR